MTYIDLDVAFKAIVGLEGGYVDDPKDPGGPTKYGVTLRVLEGWRRQTLTALDVQNLGIDEAKQIFAHQYWDKVDGSNLPPGVDLCVVDMAYNSGVGAAVRTLQRIVKVAVDGVAGAVTSHAASEADPILLIHAYCDERLAYLKTLKGWSNYARGWTNRVAAVRDHALKMASRKTFGSPATAAPVLPVMEGNSADHQQKPTATTGIQTKIAAGMGLLGTQASDAASQLTSYSDTFTTIKYVCAALTVVAMVAGFYATLQRLKEENPA